MNLDSQTLGEESSSLWLFGYYSLTTVAVSAVFSSDARNAISECFSTLKNKVQAEFKAYASPLAKKAVDLTGQALQVASKAAYIGLRTLAEHLDASDEKGRKLPETSLTNNYRYLENHDAQFAKCCQLVAEQTSQLYLKNVDKIKNKIYQIGQNHPILDPILFFLGLGNTIESLEWLLDSHQELIVKTIQANVLHLVANLIERSFDPAHPFADRQLNPLGRILAVIGSCLAPFEDRLTQMHQMSDVDKKQLFKELSQALLSQFFPRGAEDIQLFHPTIPLMGVLKEKLWDLLQEKLPLLLEHIYEKLEPAHLDQTDPDWRDRFDACVGIPDAHQIERLPSFLLQKFVCDDGGERLKAVLEPQLEKQLEAKGIPSAHELSQTLMGYIQDLLLTQDPVLHQMGRFIEHDLMSRLISNFLQFAPQQDDDTPVLVNLLQSWILGRPLELIVNDIAGKPEQTGEFVQILFKLFGLDQKQTLPLPSQLKELAWPSLQKAQQEILPAFISKKLPKWPVFAQLGQNKLAIQEWLQDPSLTESVKEITQVSMQALVKLLLNICPSLSQKIQTFVPLSSEQQQALDAQWKTLLDNQDDNLALNQVKTTVWQGLEAFVLQIFADIFENYKEECGLNSLQHLFEQDFEETSFSFVSWLTQKITQAYEKTPFENITAADLQAFKRAVYLKNAIKQMQDPVDKQTHQAELDQLWLNLKPKFGQLIQQLLTVLGYENQTKLPILDPLKPVIWNAIEKFLPKLVFDQAGDVILMLVERQHDQKIVEALPYGNLIQEGYHLLVKDVLKRLPGWLDPLLDTIPLKLSSTPLIHLSDEAKQYIGDTAKGFVHQVDPAFNPVWQMIESYMEALFFKFVIGLSQMNQDHLEQVKELVKETKERLVELEGIQDKAERELAVEEECRQFTEKLLKWLGIEIEQNLHGIPAAIRPKLLKTIKEKLAQSLLGVYRIEHQFENQLAQRMKLVPLEEEELPTSEVALATIALTRRTLNKVTQQLTKRVDGQMVGVKGIYQPLNNQLQKLTEKGYKTAEWLNQLVIQEVPTPLLEKILNLLNSQTVEGYKNQILDNINPLLTEKVVRILGPLLKKEKEGKANFDQDLLMAVLPVFTQHLKYLNAAAQKDGGINLANFTEVAEKNLHPAFQDREIFYRQQVEIILQMIFPQGKEDLKQLIPDLHFAHGHLDKVWESVIEKLVGEVPKALDQLLQEKTLEITFTSLYENILKSFDRPVVKKTMNPQKEVQPVTPVKQENKEEKPGTPVSQVNSVQSGQHVQVNPLLEVKAKGKIKGQEKDLEKVKRQQQMDDAVGELIIELARFMNLPIDRLENLPFWAKMLMGGNRLEQSTARKIGKAMRKQFNGKLLAKTIQGTLEKLTEQEKFNQQMEPKTSPSEIVENPLEPQVNAEIPNAETPVDAVIKDDVIEQEQPVGYITSQEVLKPQEPIKQSLDELERQLVEKGLVFALHLIGERIYEATDVSKHPIFKVIREATLLIGSFVLVHMVATILRFFKVDRFLTDYLLNMIKQGREKTIHVLSQPRLNEEPIYRAVEALEEVITR